MSMVTEMRSEHNDLLCLKFVNQRTGRKFRVRLKAAKNHTHFSKVHNRKFESLRSSLEIVVDGKKRTETLGGGGTLELTLQALERTQKLIPDCEEQEWVDENGIPSWIRLPKLVPISWGYELHRQLAAEMQKGLTAHIQKMDAKRLKASKN